MWGGNTLEKIDLGWFRVQGRGREDSDGGGCILLDLCGPFFGVVDPRGVGFRRRLVQTWRNIGRIIRKGRPRPMPTLSIHTFIYY